MQIQSKKIFFTSEKKMAFIQAWRNASKSALIWSLLVEHMPCGKFG